MCGKGFAISLFEGGRHAHPAAAGPAGGYGGAAVGPDQTGSPGSAGASLRKNHSISSGTISSGTPGSFLTPRNRRATSGATPPRRYPGALSAFTRYLCQIDISASSQIRICASIAARSLAFMIEDDELSLDKVFDALLEADSGFVRPTFLRVGGGPRCQLSSKHPGPTRLFFQSTSAPGTGRPGPAGRPPAPAHASWERRYARVPAGSWDAVLKYVRNTADAARLADGAGNPLLYRYAIPLYRRAADAGDSRAAGRLARRGDVDGLHTRADAADSAAGRAAGQAG